MSSGHDSDRFLNLTGSISLIVEFFEYGINSILYTRGIYPAESFDTVKNYNLQMFITKDEKLKKYLKDVTSQLESWLQKKMAQKLVLVVIGLESNEVLERWIFNIERENENVNNENKNENNGNNIKLKKTVHKEIQAIMKQIFSSSSILTLFEEQCTFDLLVYTDKEAEVPKLWEESDPKYIKNSTEVKLRSFSTSVK